MATKTATVESCGLTRQVTHDSETGESSRQSESAGTHVDNGRHSSMDSAKAEAKADIERGARDYGDTSYRGGKK